MRARYLVALTMLVLTFAAPAQARDFLIRVVDTPPDFQPLDSGKWIDNDVTPDGRHYVGYSQTAFFGDTFIEELIFVGPDEALVADRSGREFGFVNVDANPQPWVAISYQDGVPTPGIGYAGQIYHTSVPPDWGYDGIDQTLPISPDNSTQYISVDRASGYRHVAYVDVNPFGEGSGRLMWARPNFPVYDAEFVDDVEVFVERGRLTAIRVDQFDEPRIAYQSADGRIGYAQRDTDGTWSLETVFDGASLRIGHVDMVLDGAGNPHVSFYLIDSQDLMYATRSPQGVWTVETAAFNGRVGKWNSIALDPAGVPHISAYRDTDREIVMVTPAPGDTWTAEVVDTITQDSGEYSSIDIDAYGGIHIAFQDAGNGRPLHAWWLDWNGNGVHDATDIANGLLADCDGNEIPDQAEILFGFANDCDNNGIPDKCEQDCDGDGTLDACQIAADPFLDCNGNGVLDACDIAAGGVDCNNNGAIDSCELEALPFLDCDGNHVLDECDIAAGASDCDGDGIMDRCTYDMGLELAGTGDVFDFINNRAGRLVASGDFDADGLADVLVAQDGDTHLFRGASPMNDTIDQTIRSARALAVGDVDNDGFDDVAVATSSIIYGERVFVYRGGGNPVLTQDFVINSPEPHREFGASIALADLDGDGHDDLVVGAPGQLYDDTGAVYVYFSSPLDDTPDIVIDAAYPQEFGVCVANAGDLDGNGCEDIALGIPRGLTIGGEVQVHLFQPDRTSVAGPVIPGDASAQQANFGEVLAGVGDLNGDGFDDLAVGVPGYSPATGVRGRVYLHFGSASMDAASDLIIDGPAPLSRLGSSLAGGEDLNGDGFDDLVIGARGDTGSSAWIQVHFGGPFLDDIPEAGWATDTGDDDLWVGVALAPDVDGDGYAEVVYGAPGIDPHGLAYLRSVRVPAFADCDGNGILDFCDIAAGIPDVDLNGVPDPCETATAVEGSVLPARTRLVGAFPTPFNPRTTIVFELARSGPIDLTVYDTAGRRVDTVLATSLHPGRHEVVWNASSSGKPIASGVYFAVLRGKGVLERCKLVLLK